MNRSLAVFVGFLMTLPAYAYDANDYVTPASVAYVKGAHATLQEKLYNNATTSVAINSAVKTAISASSANASDSHLVTEKAIATALAGKASTAAASYTGGSGIAISSGRVVSVDKGNGLEFSGTGNAAVVKVKPYNGITVDGSGVGVKLDGTTLSVGANGLKVNTITSANIGAGEVKNGNIANSAVTLDKINSTAKKGATDTATYSGTGLTTQGYVDEKVAAAVSGLPTQDTNTTYAAGTGIEITGTNNAIGIKSSGVTATELATSAVETDKIKADAVTSAKLATSAVTEGKINAGAVTSAKLATSAVVAAAISAGAVVAAKLGTSAVTSDKINAGAVTNAKIADSAVTLGKIDSTAKQNASDSAFTNLTKLTTRGYVDERIAGLDYQEPLKTENGGDVIESKVINDLNNTFADSDKSLATMGAIKDQIDNSIAAAGHQVQLKNNAGTPVNINSAVKTAISASSANASDSHLVTEKAIATALAGKQATLTSTNVTTTGTTAGTGAVVTGVSASNGTVTVTRANVQIPVGSAAATSSYATIWIQ